MKRKAPDWPPKRSAAGLPYGTRRHGSTGQLFAARNGRWVRVRADKPVRAPRPTSETPSGHL